MVAFLALLRFMLVALAIALCACGAPAMSPSPPPALSAPPAPTSPSPPVVAPASPAPDPDDDLREIVMRELIKSFGNMLWSKRAGEKGKPVNVLCIGFGENSDPSDAFMKRIADEPRAIKASRCKQERAGRGQIRVEPGGEEAMFLHVYDVQRTGSRAEAKGSYFKDGLAAKEDLFVLELEAGKWIVKSRKMLSIS